jgi:dolichol kinase|tara:strand:+ start:1262 stop:1846 length:585 start_codon:yes stop_codon:yes gene_type:complete
MISFDEYIRKIIHLFSLIIPFGYLFFITDKYIMVQILIFLTALFLFIDIARHKVFWVQSIFEYIFNNMLRSHEIKGNLTGATWVVIGSLITIIIFPKPVAVISLIFMSLGDTAAGLVGQKYGKHKIGNKSWEGFLAGLIICFIVAINFPFLPLKISLFGALAAMIIELLPIPLDDNFKIPLASGAIMMMLSTPI